MVERQQEQHVRPKANEYGYEGKAPQIGRLLDCRNAKAPRRRRHNADSETRERAPHQIAQRTLHEKHACRTERRSNKGNENPKESFHSATVPRASIFHSSAEAPGTMQPNASPSERCL